MIDGLLAAMGTIASGGLTGLLGASITAFTKFKSKQAAYQHTERMAELSQQTLKLELENTANIARTQADADKDVAASKVFAKSFSADVAKYATGDQVSNSPWFIVVDVIRGLVRPTLTIYVMIVVTLIYWQLMQLVGGLTAIPTHDAVVMLKGVIDGLMYTATTIVLWWFGTRTKTGGNS